MFRPVRHRITLAAVALGAAGAMAASVPTVASAASSELNVIAVTGPNHALYMRTSAALPEGYRKLGGYLVDEPAVVHDSRDGSNYYLGRGSNDNVYYRSDSQGFVPLSPAVACIEPAAALSGSTLAIACKGRNGSLYSIKTTLSGGRLTVDSVSNYGGALQYGPAVAATGDPTDPFDYAVVGTNNKLYFRSDATGYDNSGYTCTDSPAIAENANGGLAACADDKKELFYFGAFGPSPTDPTAFGSAGGQVVGRPGIALHRDNSADVYVLGTNGSVYRTTVTPDSTGGRSTRFVLVGGQGLGGVAATAY